MTVILFVAISQSFTKIEQVVFELCVKDASNCGIEEIVTWRSGEGAHKLDHYLFRKMRKLQEQYPYWNQTLHNFQLIFFSTMDIKSFINQEGPGGWAGRVIHSEKWENHKNNTYNKIKFYIIFYFFFPWLILKFLHKGGSGGWARGSQGALSVQKNEKIIRTVPILISNFQ